jgi:hypothetical protein
MSAIGDVLYQTHEVVFDIQWLKAPRCRPPCRGTTLRYAMMRHSRILLVPFLFFASLLANAQYTDVQAMNDLGGPKEFAARRAELAQKLKTGYVLVLRQDAGAAGHALSRRQRLLLLHRAL